MMGWKVNATMAPMQPADVDHDWYQLKEKRFELNVILEKKDFLLVHEINFQQIYETSMY